MLIDSSLLLSDKQTILGSVSSENTIDQKAAGDACLHAMVMAHVPESFAGLESLKVALQTDDAQDFAQAKELCSATFGVADLKAGKVLLKMALPLGAKRYIRGYYTVTGTATAGKISLFVLDRTDM